MTRPIVFSIIGLISFPVTSYGQRTLILDGGTSSAAFLEIAAAPAGGLPTAPAMTANLDAGDVREAIRDRLVPLTGIAGVGKRYSGNAILVFHSDAVQYWARANSGEWKVIVPGLGAWVTPELFVGDSGTNGVAAIGNVPAISTYGLVVLALVVLVGGSLLIRKRAAVR